MLVEIKAKRCLIEDKVPGKTRAKRCLIEDKVPGEIKRARDVL